MIEEPDDPKCEDCGDDADCGALDENMDPEYYCDDCCPRCNDE